MEESQSTETTKQNETEPAKPVFSPEQVVDLNKDLHESAITLYLNEGYDKRLLPIRAKHHRNWWEEDSKTRMHARFCLPITMASGLGFYILSPATFTVQWDGDEHHDATVEIIDASSHAHITSGSIGGSFTVSSAFTPRTKELGDFVYIKSIANIASPYSVLEIMLESWWSPKEFEIVCLLNQPGKFTVKKGEPLAQMLVINGQFGEYGLATEDGYPPIWPEWKTKQTFIDRNLDYFRGRLPNGTPVCPHFKSWSEATELNEMDSDLTIDELIDAGIEAEAIENHEEALRQFTHAQHLAEEREEVSERLVLAIKEFARQQMSLNKFELSMKLLLACVNLNQRYFYGELDSTADIYTNLAHVYEMLDDSDAAAKHYENSLQAKRKIGDPLYLVQTLVELGALHDHRRNFDRATELFEEARIILQELPPDDPNNLFLKNSTAIMLTNQGKFEEAAKLYEELIETRSKQSGEESLDVAATLIDLAFHYKARKDFEAAERYYKKSLALRTQLLGPDDLQVGEIHEHLHWIYKDCGRPQDAVEPLKKALEIRRKALLANDPIVRSNYRLLGDLYLELGETELGKQALLYA